MNTNISLKDLVKLGKDFNNKIIEGDKNKKVIYISKSRQIKQKLINDTSEISIQKLLKSDNLVKVSCSRLAIGPLKNKIIKIYYNPNIKIYNKLGSKIANFPISSDIVIVNENGDFTMDNYLEISKLLGI